MCERGQWQQYRQGRRWRWIEGDDGLRTVEIEGVGVPRSKGEPQTMRRMWEDFSAALIAAHERFPAVSIAQLMATIAVESARRPGSLSRDPRSHREEPGYVSDSATPGRVSPGIMQTLIETARWVSRRYELGLDGVGRRELYVAATSILLGAGYLDYQMGRYGDPMMADAAYNAGSLRADDSHPYGWVTYHHHRADQWAQWHNDAVAVLREFGVRG